MSEDLAVLRAEFPAYEVWREGTPGRVRYVARSRAPGVNPHTLITADVEELREVLRTAPKIGSAPPAFCPTEPNIARMYSYWLHEKDHYAADRAAVGQILERFPEVANVARANRAFVTRAVRYLAQQGITQFIDAGSGLPVSPNVHETARTVTPHTRVVYVDRDPVVLTHARALLAVDDNVGAVAADIRDPVSLFADATLTRVIERYDTKLWLRDLMEGAAYLPK